MRSGARGRGQGAAGAESLLLLLPQRVSRARTAARAPLAGVGLVRVVVLRFSHPPLASRATPPPGDKPSLLSDKPPIHSLPRPLPHLFLLLLGEVPGLFSSEELAKELMPLEQRRNEDASYQGPPSLYAYFIHR